MNASPTPPNDSRTFRAGFGNGETLVVSSNAIYRTDATGDTKTYGHLDIANARFHLTADTYPYIEAIDDNTIKVVAASGVDIFFRRETTAGASAR